MTAVQRSTVLARLDRLERENRLLRRAAACVLAIGLTAVLTAQARGGRTVAVERLVLRDAQGVQHGVLEVAPDGSTRLRLGSGDGTSVVQLEAAATGAASVSLSGNYGATAPTVRLDVSPDDFTGLYVEVGSTAEGISLGAIDGRSAGLEWTQGDAQAVTRARLSGANVLQLLRQELGRAQ